MEKWIRAKYQPNLPLGENGKKVTESIEHTQLSKNAAKDGMVLLKNDNHVLPLPMGSKVALFGKGTFDYVKGGGGSGDVTVSYIHNLYDGLKMLCLSQIAAPPERPWLWPSLSPHREASARGSPACRI